MNKKDHLRHLLDEMKGIDEQKQKILKNIDNYSESVLENLIQILETGIKRQNRINKGDITQVMNEISLEKSEEKQKEYQEKIKKIHNQEKNAQDNDKIALTNLLNKL